MEFNRRNSITQSNLYRSRPSMFSESRRRPSDATTADNLLFSPNLNSFNHHPTSTPQSVSSITQHSSRLPLNASLIMDNDSPSIPEKDLSGSTKMLNPYSNSYITYPTHIEPPPLTQTNSTPYQKNTHFSRPERSFKENKSGVLSCQSCGIKIINQIEFYNHRCLPVRDFSEFQDQVSEASLRLTTLQAAHVLLELSGCHAMDK